jgi:membrane-associated protease RseP (regulator of RpoE activity)
LTEGPPGPSRREIAACLASLAATFCSCTFTYAWGETPARVLWGWYGADTISPVAWAHGVQFACGLLAILVAHEAGHYLVGRAHGMSSTLPLFIPFPSIFGTMGAVIGLRSPPASRQALLEMGAAGPLAGAVVAVAILWWSLPGASVPEHFPGGPATIFEDPLLVKLIGLATTGAAPDRLAVYPPLAWAGWVGCFITGLNLVPLGQFDGGHVLRGVLGDRVERARWWVVAAIAALGLRWSTWWLWLVLAWAVGAARSLPVPEHPTLPARARLVALAVLALFVLTFIPIPFTVETLPPR